METIIDEGVLWCVNCSAVDEVEGRKYILLPSPGRVYDTLGDDAVNAWEDCYEKKPKRRILTGKAKDEILRAWKLWDGDKSNNLSMFTFFAWLQRYRPYFLTFRAKGDPWQRAHSWLLEHERKSKSANK